MPADGPGRLGALFLGLVCLDAKHHSVVVVERSVEFGLGGCFSAFHDHGAIVVTLGLLDAR